MPTDVTAKKIKPVEDWKKVGATLPAPSRPSPTPPPGKLAITGASLEWIAADAFTVDPSYDRPIHDNRVNEMAENWKDEALGVVFASRRQDEDKLFLLDGQHRVGALKKQGRKTELVPALVFEGLSVAEEAELFRMMNKNRRPLLPSELFKASLVEGDKEALEIQAVIEGLGLRLESLATGDAQTVRCVSTIWRIYRALGAEGVDATLSLIVLAWGEPPPKSAFNQNLVLALARIIFYEENKVDMDRLRSVLASESPDALLSRADSIRSLAGGELNGALIDQICDGYNKGMRSSSKQIDSRKVKRLKKDRFTSATQYQRGKAS